MLLLFKASTCAALFFCATAFVVRTWHWPLVGDASLLHYVVFLMQQGAAPYREIVDLNQPGALALQAGVISLFGDGALPWRLYDLALLLAIAAAMFSICRIAGWLPALFASVVFALIHARDGLIQLGQRDLSMAMFLVVSYALLLRVLRSTRRDLYAQTCAAGLCLGAACTIKLIALPLIPFFLFFLARELRRDQRCWRLHWTLASSGIFVPLLASLLFLMHTHLLGAFLALTVQLAPLHASLWRLSSRALLLGSISSVMLPLACCWLPIFVAGRRWRLQADRGLLAGFAFGIFSFFLQGRGYPYHRYPSEVFLLLLIALAFRDTIARPARQAWPLKVFAFTGILFGTWIVVPRSLAQALRFDWQHDPVGDALQADLVSLGGGG